MPHMDGMGMKHPTNLVGIGFLFAKLGKMAK